ncbi:5893_t:CDS:1, partial [Funneliformis geosporum]
SDKTINNNSNYLHTRRLCVLDYFAGSGTTAAVAQKLKRKWVI